MHAIDIDLDKAGAVARKPLGIRVANVATSAANWLGLAATPTFAVMAASAPAPARSFAKRLEHGRLQPFGIAHAASRERDDPAGDEFGGLVGLVGEAERFACGRERDAHAGEQLGLEFGLVNECAQRHWRGPLLPRPETGWSSLRESQRQL